MHRTPPCVNISMSDGIFHSLAMMEQIVRSIHGHQGCPNLYLETLQDISRPLFLRMCHRIHHGIVPSKPKLGEYIGHDVSWLSGSTHKQKKNIFLIPRSPKDNTERHHIFHDFFSHSPEKHWVTKSETETKNEDESENEKILQIHAKLATTTRHPTRKLDVAT